MAIRYPSADVADAGEQFERAERISEAADVDELAGFLRDPSIDYEVKVFAARTFGLSAPSIGTCTICGEPLQFEGHPGELRVCCVREHCWKMSGEQV